MSINIIFVGVAKSKDVPDCKAITRAVEVENGLPKYILSSISVVEAGRISDDGTIKPWPWALNHAGKSLFFESKMEALEYLNKNITKDFRNIDVGCMQINVKWHFENFNSFKEMLDPTTNIKYAASFILRLKEKHGSWEKAIKLYHSATTSLNVKYFAKVKKAWKVQEDAVVQTASLFLDENIFYENKKNFSSGNSQYAVEKKLAETPRPVIKLETTSRKTSENGIYLNAVFNRTNKIESETELKRYMKFKSAYLRKNIDMILLFRDEFSKTK